MPHLSSLLQPQPHKFGKPKLDFAGDTIVASLTYAGQRVADANMSFKSHPLTHCEAAQLLQMPEV
jgi:acetoacetate decarboxylase